MSNIYNTYVDNVYTNRNDEADSYKPNIYVDRLRFKNTICFFYDACINRVNTRRVEKKLSEFQVYNTDDKSLICNFFNGVCTKNNPYLVTDKLVGFYKDRKRGWIESTNEAGNKIGFIHTLDFNNSYDIIWGTDFELQKNLYLIFRNLMYDIPKYLPNYTTDIQTVLFDYIPYAKYTTFANIKEDKKISSLLPYYGIYDEDVAPIKLIVYREQALKYLFMKPNFNTAFKNSFMVFIKDIINFTKIDKKLENNYVVPKFIPLLKEYLKDKDSSLGLRVKSLIESDISKSQEIITNLRTKHPYSNYNLTRDLIHASAAYIIELEKIQEESIDPLFYM